jgi:hypothetical protein
MRIVGTNGGVAGCAASPPPSLAGRQRRAHRPWNPSDHPDLRPNPAPALQSLCPPAVCVTEQCYYLKYDRARTLSMSATTAPCSPTPPYTSRPPCMECSGGEAPSSLPSSGTSPGRVQRLKMRCSTRHDGKGRGRGGGEPSPMITTAAAEGGGGGRSAPDVPTRGAGGGRLAVTGRSRRAVRAGGAAAREVLSWPSSSLE